MLGSLRSKTIASETAAHRPVEHHSYYVRSVSQVIVYLICRRQHFCIFMTKPNAESTKIGRNKMSENMS